MDGWDVGVQIGEDGAVVVDSGDAAHADRLVAELKKLMPGPIRHVINTGAEPDHVGGNEKVAKAGRTLFEARLKLALVCSPQRSSHRVGGTFQRCRSTCRVSPSGQIFRSG